MAGYREFQTGEVLTAANVNDFLGKQAVMKFADSAARDTALGTAVAGGNALREGMVAWLDSDDELQAYDGSVWSAVGTTPTIRQVVLTTDTTDRTITSTSYADASISVSITPLDASSRILLVFNCLLRARRNGVTGTSTDAGLQIADASDNQITGTGGSLIQQNFLSSSTSAITEQHVTLVGSVDATDTSTRSYKVRVKSVTGQAADIRSSTGGPANLYAIEYSEA